jgi:hypothetical protein
VVSRASSAAKLSSLICRRSGALAAPKAQLAFRLEGGAVPVACARPPGSAGRRVPDLNPAGPAIRAGD